MVKNIVIVGILFSASAWLAMHLLKYPGGQSRGEKIA
jgi:hypothetical protein